MYQDSNRRFKYRMKFNFNWEIYILELWGLKLKDFKSLYIKILWG